MTGEKNAYVKMVVSWVGWRKPGTQKGNSI